MIPSALIPDNVLQLLGLTFAISLVWTGGNAVMSVLLSLIEARIDRKKLEKVAEVLTLQRAAAAPKSSKGGGVRI